MPFDYREFKKLTENLDKLSLIIDDEIEKFFYEMALKALARTKKRTTVLTGDLRKQWTLSEIKKDGNNLSIILSNPLEYASWVEFGHRVKKHFVSGEWQGNKFVYNPDSDTGTMMGMKTSWVEGKFMATISLKEIQELIPTEWDKRFKKLIGGAI
jgi:hypothetical protein